MQDALVDIEDALSDHIAWLQSAAQDDETNAKSEAELQRAAWRPLLRAA